MHEFLSSKETKNAAAKYAICQAENFVAYTENFKPFNKRLKAKIATICNNNLANQIDTFPLIGDPNLTQTFSRLFLQLSYEIGPQVLWNTEKEHQKGVSGA